MAIDTYFFVALCKKRGGLLEIQDEMKTLVIDGLGELGVFY